ncbi:MAG: hypothetical protein JNM80_07755 [Phycisphaerae bacterium]|nr:hypothetical protein [Phycisphaerae bacterium]
MTRMTWKDAARVAVALSATHGLTPEARAAAPYGAAVVAYTPGAGATPGYTNPASALGEPSRFIADPNFPGAVTPFNAPYLPEQVVSIGAGGSLTLAFEQPVLDDPMNPFGIDLLVFGNSFFFDPITFEPIARAISADGGTVEVSADGQTWFLVPGAQADGLFPTLGYVDVTDPYSSPAGVVPTDFTRPVDPGFAWLGADLATLVAGYNGSGGGAGIDLASVGLASASFVRLSLAAGGGGAGNIEIDAVSDVSPVPAPGVAAVGVLALASRRRRRA